jgi:hypothetical protein
MLMENFIVVVDVWEEGLVDDEVWGGGSLTVGTLVEVHDVAGQIGIFDSFGTETESYFKVVCLERGRKVGRASLRSSSSKYERGNRSSK